MNKKPINIVLAENLAHFMSQRKLTQKGLSALSDVGQTTISLYLNPERRQTSKSGKMPSAKLSEVESLALALEVDVWELLRPFTEQERIAYKHLEAAYKAMSDGKQEADDTKSGSEAA
ncbi:hypothetical protein W822_20100 [Advenella kashmirensis W13003]|uniref:HTH cro/C1-type domain-containing protein n=2 Tax=Advenella kashmirensis TaxID=310575 RepID=V8QLV4_9BURK|nr:hypothetical protein W822_20100 [Advenella kashmirensis W13003]